MGLMIATVMLATMYVLWRASRAALPEPGLAAAIRWGLAISILGGWLGAVMTVPNRAQREAMAAGQEVSFQGGHGRRHRGWPRPSPGALEHDRW